MASQTGKITVRSLLVGAFFSALFSFVTVYSENRNELLPTATQIAVMPYVLLFLSVLLINPLCRLVRFVRTFSVAEILTVFAMGSVSAGISTFGLASQLVPVVSSLNNQHWNTQQAKWDIYVEPYVNDDYFISTPGTREAAGDYAQALSGFRELRSIFRLASNVVGRQEALKVAEADLRHVEQAEDDPATKTAKIGRATRALRFAQKAVEQAETAWEPYRAEYEIPQVLATYPALIEAAERKMEQKRAALAELHADAFKAVDTFRRGLTEEGKRAIPGFVKSPQENFSTYLARLRRLRCGMGSLKSLRAAVPLLESSDAAARQDGLSPQQRTELDGLLQEAAEALAPVGDPSDDQELKEGLKAESEKLAEELLGVNAQLKQLRQERRSAPATEFKRLDSAIGRLAGRAATIQGKQKSLKVELEGVESRLSVTEKVADTVGALEELRASLAAPEPVAAAAVTRSLNEIVARYSFFDGTLRRFLIGEVPWSIWVRPLLRWGLLIGLKYLILMTFNVLIFRQWAHNEKLIYPLAELPEMLAGASVTEPVSPDEVVPPLYKRGLFWAGFTITAVIQGWNLLCSTGKVSGLAAIKLSFPWDDYIKGSLFQGLVGEGRFEIFFTMIGLSFLVPAKISFSLWIFFLLYLGQILVLVWLGYGVNLRSFPAEWWSTLNFHYAEGGGALLVFAVVVLWKCRKYLFCFFTPASVAMLEPGERKELRISSFLFVFGSLALVVMLWQSMGANLFYTCFFYLVVLVITIGLVRAVAEGGILGFQCWFGPFHLIRSLFGLGKAWTSASLYAPLMTFYSVMFLDIKTFIAPAMANCVKIRDDLKLSRIRFHLAMILGIGLATVTAVGAHLLLAYDKGADAMHAWFYVSFPKKTLFKCIVSMTTMGPSEAATSGALWLAFGAVLMALLLYGRRHLFWLPHPIGMIMLVNPLMRAYWSSIFLGWLAKSLVTKYGNKETYLKGRRFFIGMILGEVLCVAAAVLVAYALHMTKVGVSMNKN